MVKGALLSIVLLGVLLGTVPRVGGVAYAEGGVRQRYAAGMKHFDLGEYESALTEFREAYRIKDDPAFLYNIAQCYRLLKNNTEAIRFYRNYLRRAPTAPNRAEVEGRIDTLQQELDAEEQAKKAAVHVEPQVVQPAPTTPALDLAAKPAPPPRRPVYKKWWFWVAIGGGAAVVAGVVAGVVVGTRSKAATSPFNGVTF